MKKLKGITLISLVITIVVLLILTGVTISLTLGENGLITRAQQAKEKHEEAANNEVMQFQDIHSQINEQLTGIKIEQVTDANPGQLEGNGTTADPYVINSIEDLVFFAYNVTSGNTYEGQTVTLGLNLDFNSSKSYVEATRTDYGEYGYDGELKTLLTTGEGFKPIGSRIPITDTDGNDITSNYCFAGDFNGNNNSIINLYKNIKTRESSFQEGFFTINYGNINNLQLIKR